MNATPDTAEDLVAAQHLQVERRGLITSAEFQIKQNAVQTDLRIPPDFNESSLCADSLTLILCECDIPRGPASTGRRDGGKVKM